MVPVELIHNLYTRWRLLISRSMWVICVVALMSYWYLLRISLFHTGVDMFFFLTFTNTLFLTVFLISIKDECRRISINHSVTDRFNFSFKASVALLFRKIDVFFLSLTLSPNILSRNYCDVFIIAKKCDMVIISIFLTRILIFFK